MHVTVCTLATSYIHYAGCMPSIYQYMVNLIISSVDRGLLSLLMYVSVWERCTFYIIIVVGKISCSDPIFIWCFLQAPVPSLKFLLPIFALHSPTIIFVSCTGILWCIWLNLSWKGSLTIYLVLFFCRCMYWNYFKIKFPVILSSTASEFIIACIYLTTASVV